jgi:hypothetical protein
MIRVIHIVVPMIIMAVWVGVTDNPAFFESVPAVVMIDVLMLMLVKGLVIS